MNWDTRAYDLFCDLMQNGPPQSLREAATRAIGEAAERNAEERQSPCIEMVDVVRACLTETPAAFRPRMLADLTRSGVDVSAYQEAGS